MTDLFRELYCDSDSGEEDFLGFENPSQDSGEDNIDATDVSDVSDTDVSTDSDGETSQCSNQTVDFGDAYEHRWLIDFQRQCGPLLHTDESSEFQIFSDFFTPQIIQLFTEETNRYAADYLQDHSLSAHSRARRWESVTDGDVRAFLALLIIQGHVRLPDYPSYWSTDYYTELPGVRSIMSRDKFQNILRFFHLCNNSDNLPSEHPDHDRLFKIRRFLSHLVGQWQSAYYPGREASVDESIIAFKGRSRMVVYKPNKPHKWGLNAWVLADPSGYMWNWELYTGKKGQTESGLTKNVVLSLCQPIFGHGHHIYMDNYFSSPALFGELRDNQTGACGTLRTNRSGVPTQIKTAKLSKKKNGMVVERDGDLMYIAWYDKRQVNLISSVHTAATFQKSLRAKAAPNHRRVVEKPKAVELYTKYMQGVDRGDQLLWYKLHLHKSLKWWKKVFMYLLEVSLVNASIIYKTFHPKATSASFRMAVVYGLLQGHAKPDYRPAHRRTSNPPTRLTERHWLAWNPQKTPGKQAKPDCVVCSQRGPGVKRHQTETICKQCCVPLCPVPCFQRFHSVVDYKVVCTKEYHRLTVVEQSNSSGACSQASTDTEAS